MVKANIPFDAELVRAEENLLIDFQFLVQELMDKRGLSRTELARKAGISTARLSQILSSEANPTVKTFAGIFHALDARVSPVCEELSSIEFISADIEIPGEWRVEPESVQSRETKFTRTDRDEVVGKLLDWASNDNYDHAITLEAGVKSLRLKAA